ncbi:MAG: c-type cytochrome [Candidatus Acidiferrales bacterium]
MRDHNAMAAAAAFALLLVWGLAEQPAAAQSSAPGVANGKTVFASAGCITCHGAQAQGTSLAPAIAPPPLELPAMITYVRQPTGKMPPVAEATASDGQLADVFAYLQSIAPETPSAGERKGDAENGKKLFAAYGCYECHGRQGAGASTGPRIGPPGITLAAILRYVRAPAGQMPPYTAKVASDQDFADIYAYLKSFPTPAPAKDIPLLNP